MPGHDFLNVVGDMYPSHIYRPILPHKTTHATHIVPVVAMPIPPKAVHIRVEQVVRPREPVQVIAVLSLDTNASREMQAEVAAIYAVGLRIPAVFRNIAPTARLGFGEVLVLAITAGPFVVPDVEDGTCLGRRFGGQGVGVYLDAGWALLLANDFADLLLCRRRDFGRCRCERCVGVFCGHRGIDWLWFRHIVWLVLCRKVS